MNSNELILLTSIGERILNELKIKQPERFNSLCDNQRTSKFN